MTERVRVKPTSRQGAAEAATILLGSKIIGHLSYVPRADRVELLDVVFVAPGFRQTSADAPLEQQQDALLRELLGDGVDVQRSSAGVFVRVDGVEVARAPTWDVAFRRAAMNSIALEQALRALASEQGAPLFAPIDRLSRVGELLLARVRGAYAEVDGIVVPSEG